MANIGNNTWAGVTYGIGKYVAVGVDGVAISSDGNSWELVSNSPTGLNKITCNGNRFIAVSGDGHAFTSDNGYSWNSVGKMGSTITGNGIASASNIVVACGNAGYIAFSTNAGDSWEEVKTSTVDRFTSITYGNGRFVAVGEDGVFANSYNGRDWNVSRIKNIATLEGVAFGDGKFVAVGNRNSAISTDGLSWTLHSNVTSSGARTVAFCNGTWLIAGSNGMIEKSTDGIKWEKLPSVGKTIFGSTAFVS